MLLREPTDLVRISDSGLQRLQAVHLCPRFPGQALESVAMPGHYQTHLVKIADGLLMRLERRILGPGVDLGETLEKKIRALAAGSREIMDVADLTS